MATSYKIDGDQAGEQEQRTGERSRFEGVERENRVYGRVNSGRSPNRIGGMREQRNDSLEHAQRFMRARRLGRSLRV
ncbi:MAG TPA: hypothetical protein VMG40_18580 [Bryobacteraceae bacterium]|nr:hypothetical protein [Bryobacteraceae bacterium]